MKKAIRRKALLISIVIPFFNEEGNIEELYRRLEQLMTKEKKYNFEIIAVEHGSIDNTLEKLQLVRKYDKRLKILQLSKNFGNVDAAITAGLAYASGDAAVILMGDLQDPPEVIPKFIRKWEQGFETVYGIIKKRADISWVRRFNSFLFYKILSLATGNIFPPNVSDFRLMDKKVYQTVNEIPERNRFLRGLTIWTGFKQTGVPFERSPRYAGESKADFITVLKLAANGIFAFSFIPLRAVTILGFIVSLLSFSAIIFELILVLLYGKRVPGILTIVVLTGFLFGVLFIILGILGEYLARIYEEVKQRPIYIVKRKFGL